MARQTQHSKIPAFPYSNPPVLRHTILKGLPLDQHSRSQEMVR